MSQGRPFQDKPTIRVETLALARGGRVLFEGVSFSAAPGSFVALRGPNGAGKTSLLRALAGYLRPGAGQVAIDGTAEPALALHYIGHANALKREACVGDHLRYWAGLFGIANFDASAALAAFGLVKHADLPVRALSQGQARRLALMRLHIAPRPIWLLDEPAAALDADGKALLAGLIESHCKQGGIAIAAVHEALGPAPTQTLALGA